MEFLVETFQFWKRIISGILGIRPRTPNPNQKQSNSSFQIGPWRTPTLPFAVIPSTAPVKPSYAPLLAPPSPKKAIVASVGSSEFNPNMIITNREFLDCSSMSETQIQDFIVMKNSFLKDYVIDGHLTSYWIYKHCNDLGLNPKVLITNIQKEQGTITRKTMPKNKRRLDYFCGVGAYDPPRGDDPKWSGVDKQILGAVQVNTRRYNKALAFKFPHAFITDKPERRSLQIQNAATMSLYNYTPFVGDVTKMIGKNKYENPFGNNLFWYVYKKWFGFVD